MEYAFATMVLGLLLYAIWPAATKQLHNRHNRLEEVRLLPPGPKPWPVFGNILQLVGRSSAPHRSFAKLADQYGDVMTLHLGSMTTVVISSSAAAGAIFRNHDVIFAGRTIYESMKGEIGNEGSLITSQYGPHWRMLRRLCTAGFFAAAPLNDMLEARGKCVDRMVQYMRDASSSGAGRVDVGRFFFLMAFNMIANLTFTKNLLDPKSERGVEFFYHAGKVMEIAGKPNVADFLPFLKWADPQGIRKRTQFHVKRAFDVVGEFLKERLREMGNGPGNEEKRKDYLDVLLEYKGDGCVEGSHAFSPTIINAIVFEMFTAGTDTTTSTLEWAMTELLHNPKALEKVQTEIRKLIGPGRKVQEQNMDKLPYLKAVIKETLRLHPPLPFLVPRKSLDSCKFLGFNIPKETQILVNVWALGRDPNNWKDPLEFEPNRFLDPKLVDYKGKHFEFIPFGSGRRMCPAVPLATRVLSLALGSTLYSFDWVLADNMKAKEMDMRERMGITLRKDVPLKVIPIPYVFV